MSKRIEVKIGKWVGAVEIADPLTIPQAQAIEAGMKPLDGGEDGKVFLSQIDSQQLPAVVACVTKWDVTNIPEQVTADTFPASPRKESHALIEYLYREVLKVYFGELEIPNG
jgi:hypothetical protein